jgi:phenylacetate-CoA ligase
MSVTKQLFLQSLRDSAHWSDAEREDDQIGKLHRLVRHAVQQSPFYRDRLGAVCREDGTVDLRYWHRVPIITKAELQAAGDDIHAVSIPEKFGKWSTFWTSGSTATPVASRLEQYTSAANNAMVTRGFEWAGFDTSKSMAAIIPGPEEKTRTPDGIRGKGWSWNDPEAPFAEINVLTGVDVQSRWLEEIRPDYLQTYQSNLKSLYAHMGEKRFAALGLSGVSVVAEPLDRDFMEMLEERHGITLAHTYSCIEAGHMAARCRRGGRLHVSAENVLLELVDEEGLPAQPGEIARVVVTPLYRYATPMIRLALGDLAVGSPATDCPCGVTHPCLDAVLGRERNMFIYADGTRALPSIETAELQKVMPHLQYQCVQTAQDHVEFRLVPLPDRPPDLQALNAYVRRRLHPSLSASVTIVSDIPRHPSGKFIDYLCEVDPNG